MYELSRNVVQAREFLTVTEKTLSSIDRYANTFTTKWSQDAQEDIEERIETIKHFSKKVHQIEKRAGLYKRRLDNEIKLVDSY